jgi:hypothetical protein
LRGKDRALRRIFGEKGASGSNPSAPPSSLAVIDLLGETFEIRACAGDFRLHMGPRERPFAAYYQTEKYSYEWERNSRLVREPVTLQRVRALITEPASNQEVRLGD